LAFVVAIVILPGNKLVFLAGADWSHMAMLGIYLYSGGWIITRHVLVTSTQCTGKCITYTCSLDVRHYYLRCARRRAVAALCSS